MMPLQRGLQAVDHDRSLETRKVVSLIHIVDLSLFLSLLFFLSLCRVRSLSCGFHGVETELDKNKKTWRASNVVWSEKKLQRYVVMIRGVTSLRSHFGCDWFSWSTQVSCLATSFLFGTFLPRGCSSEQLTRCSFTQTVFPLRNCRRNFWHNMNFKNFRFCISIFAVIINEAAFSETSVTTSQENKSKLTDFFHPHLTQILGVQNITLHRTGMVSCVTFKRLLTYPSKCDIGYTQISAQDRHQ